MDQYFTSLNKRQAMLLLTAVTFGGQEGHAAFAYLPPDEAELLGHRAQELSQVPRDKRIPKLVQEIKRLVKDQRSRLWSADPVRLASLLRRERVALVEVVLRALPVDMAEEVREQMPNVGRARLSREVRPQVLDIVRWKLEELLTRNAAPPNALKFTDVILLRARELLTLVDRLGSRVLGPALAGLLDEERERLMGPLPPDLRQLAAKAATANAPRKLTEDNARAHLGQFGGREDLASAIRSAGTQRLARACLHQSPEFAARMVERHRGDFGQLFARWVREERTRPPSRGDGGRADIVMDMERLAARGFIDRPLRLRPPSLNSPAASGSRRPARSISREGRAVDPGRRSGGSGSHERVRRPSTSGRGVRRAATSESEPARLGEDQEGSRIIRSTRSSSGEVARPESEATSVRPRPAPRSDASGRGSGEGSR